jgi:dipeptidyl aminopeptidase/acylaminoacyl peptidase
MERHVFYLVNGEKIMKTIEMNTFLDFKSISGLQANPSKTRYAYLVSKTNLEKNTYHYILHIKNEDKIKLFNLKSTSQFIWESDNQILFPFEKTKEDKKQKKDKYTIYYRYNVETEKLDKAYTFKIPVTILKVLKQNKLLLSSQLSHKSHLLYLEKDLEKRAQILKQNKQEQAYYDIEEIPFYFNGSGFIANLRNQLFIYHANEDKYEPIVDKDFNVQNVRVNDDLSKIYYTGLQASPVKKFQSDVFCYDINKQSTSCLYSLKAYQISSLYLIKNQVLVAATDMKDFGMNQNKDFYVVQDQELKLLCKFSRSIGSTIGTDVRLGGNVSDIVIDEALYFIETIDDHTALNKLTLKGELETVYHFDGSLDGLCFVQDKIIAVGLYRQRLHDLYILDLEQRKVKKISNHNTLSNRSHYIAKPKTFIYKDKDHEVKGFLLYPKDYDLEKSYPAILNIHGGPKTVYGQVYYHEMQYWANQGYFVLFANPRGSDGKQNEFADIRGKYGTIDADDLMNFTQLVLKKVPSIDQNRLFVTGGSYGGFMTNWLVGHTHLFKAAATQRSISNWLSFYGTSDIGYYFAKDQTAGHPLVDLNKLWEQSPIKYANDIKTPLLIIHSDEDYRCPIEQAMQLYTILKENGVRTKLVWFKQENHELSRSGKPQARLKRLDEITRWFNQYL